MTYQDILDSAGRVVSPGSRDCATRWDAIHADLGDRSGFTALDLGAYEGYFARRLVLEHAARVTAVDNWRGVHAVDDVVTVINRRLSPSEVDKLGPFDVGLALSVLHHIPEWPDMLAVLLNRCDTLYLEVPHPDEVLPKAVAHSRDLCDTVAALGGVPLAEAPGHRSDIPRTLWRVQ